MNHNRYGWIGILFILLLMVSCLPYEDVHEAGEDPKEASYAFGTLNDDPWEAETTVEGGIDVAMHTRKGKVLLAVYGLQEFSSVLYWDALSVRYVSLLKSLSHVDLNDDQDSNMFVMYNLMEYDVSVAYYELDKTQENYLKLSPMWGSADYMGEMEVHLVKTRSVDYAPPTPDTLHLVVEEFRATRLK